MKKTNQKGAATAPQTPAQVKQMYQTAVNDHNQSVAQNGRDTADSKTALAKMSKELYGTENYSLKPNYWKHIVWFLVLVVVAGIEIPINAASFEIFGRSQMVTTIMAYAFGLVLAALAQFTGRAFKRAYVEKKTYFAGVLLFMTAVALMVAIAWFRVNYFNRMGLKDSVDLFSQAGFSIFIFVAGAAACYFHTTDAKNVHLEKVFKQEQKKLRKLIIDAKKLQLFKTRLDKQFAFDLARAEKFEKESLAQAEKENQEKQLELEQKKETEKNQKINDFNNAKAQFNKSYIIAKEMYDSKTDKKELLSNSAYMEANGFMENAVAQMETLYKDVPAGMSEWKNAIELFNALKIEA